jgi:hypothetical protein
MPTSPFSPKVREYHAEDLATAADMTVFAYFPRAARLLGMFLASEAALVAHATNVLDLTVTDRGTDGTGTTALGVITNDSDLTDVVATEAVAGRNSQAYTAKTAAYLDLTTRDAEGAADIAAGSIVELNLNNASGATQVTSFGLVYLDSD